MRVYKGKLRRKEPKKEMDLDDHSCFLVIISVQILVLGIRLHFFMAPIPKLYSIIGIWDNRNVSSYSLSSEIQEDRVLVNPPFMKLQDFCLDKFGGKNYEHGCFILIPFTLCFGHIVIML